MKAADKGTHWGPARYYNAVPLPCVTMCGVASHTDTVEQHERQQKDESMHFDTSN